MFRTMSRHGRLDVLVNNAGMNVRGFRHISDADWVRIREVNLDGVVRVAREGFNLLRVSGNGSLINLSSIMASRGLRQLASYSATKGAVSALTRACSRVCPVWHPVNALAPGFIETALTERVLRNPVINKALLDRTPLRRFGTAEDVAGARCSSLPMIVRSLRGRAGVDGGMAASL